MSGDDLQDLVERSELADDLDQMALIDQLRRHPALDDADTVNTGLAARVARLLVDGGEPGDLPNIVRLSLVAHEAEIEGAGLIHAEASDKIALYTGRPQLYGTVMFEHEGDIVQPPVNPAISDDQREALGVPPLGELQERMNRLSRELAVERAGQPGWLPDGQRYCRVWTDPDPADLRARMAVDGSAWADGDVLTLVAESPVPVAATPVFSMTSWHAGDGLQVLSMRVERLDEAVITYTFTPVGGGGVPQFSRGSHDGRFRGPNAPAELPSNDPINGSLDDHAVESAALGEPRRVNVYRPPGHQVGDDVSVLYATDGNMFSPYARRLDAAIENGTCPPVVVVAAASASFDPIEGNRRAAEYLPGFDRRLFENHETFFVEELVDWAETKLGVPTDPARRGVFGCSDGGGHALMVAQRHPHRYGQIFAYSTGMPPEMTTQWDVDTYPFIHLCAGTLEGAFHQATEAWAGFLHMHGAGYHFTDRVAGHDLIQWCEELPRALQRAWG
jgi:enterochelin esterase-like enzyme